MSVLVLHQIGSLRGSPYHEWLDGHDGDVLLLTCAENLRLVAEELPPPGSGYAHAEALDGYDGSGLLEERALDLARERGVRHVVACHERDLERAAVLREILSLPGQRMDTVEPFRDKTLMKRIAADAGLAVAPWREVECAADIAAHAGRHGFPVVVKPHDSAGSMGLSVLHSEGELRAYLADDAAHGLYGPDRPGLLVEAYVPGRMCHVDGMVVNGRTVFAWPSQYQYALATFRTDTGPRMDLTLDVDDPLAGRLLEFTGRLLAAMPQPEQFTFHAEVFHTPDDELVLCEIACRTGGAAIRDIVRIMYGVDPTEAWVRAQLGLPLPEHLGDGPGPPRRMAGQMVLMKRPGRVVSVPREAPGFPWLERFTTFVKPGQVMGPATASSDFLVMALVSGGTRAECVERLRRVEEWFSGELVLEPADG
ncbi:acetyl-CoA carboxylase biotin carboxylase subunit family protein [Streptomyces sp. NPDC001812]|uniref:ATP-grasp domain-containing protein n=1 Tax=Streptomyces sp. NPDC001812 TaxID=3364611 RepID=UPI0036786D03